MLYSCVLWSQEHPESPLPDRVASARAARWAYVYCGAVVVLLAAWSQLLPWVERWGCSVYEEAWAALRKA